MIKSLFKIYSDKKNSLDSQKKRPKDHLTDKTLLYILLIIATLIPFTYISVKALGICESGELTIKIWEFEYYLKKVGCNPELHLPSQDTNTLKPNQQS